MTEVPSGMWGLCMCLYFSFGGISAELGQLAVSRIGSNVVRQAIEVLALPSFRRDWVDTTRNAMTKSGLVGRESANVRL